MRLKLRTLYLAPLLVALLALGVVIDLPILAAESTSGSIDHDNVSDHDLAGEWHGHLTVGEAQLRIIFHIERTADGDLSATMDSPDQGAMGLPVSSVRVDGAEAELNLAALGARFSGKISDDGQAIEGQWKQAGQSLPLRVERAPVAALAIGVRFMPR